MQLSARHAERRSGVLRGGGRRGGRARRPRPLRRRGRRRSPAGGGSCYCMQTPRDLAEVAAARLRACWRWPWSARLLIPNWGSAANRLLSPWEFVPSVGSVEIVSVTPGNAEVLVGEQPGDRGRDRQSRRPGPTRRRCWSTADKAKEERLADERRRAAARYFKAHRAVGRQAAEVPPGDRRFADRDLHGTVCEKPTIDEVEVTFHYPAVSGPAGRNVHAKDGRPGGPAVHRGRVAAAALGADRGKATCRCEEQTIQRPR